MGPRFATLALALLVIISSFDCAQGNIALLIIDVQNCFLPEGSLAVPEGEQVIPVINNIRRLYGDQIDITVLTKDWHCKDHVSFASMHAGKNPYDEIMLRYDVNGTLCTNGSCDAVYNVTQMLWPDHCVKNTSSSKLSTSLVTEDSDVIVLKGYDCEVDSYSGFNDNGGFHHTELNDILKQNNITTVIITGLALDYCVYYTSIDARKLGYETYTITDASRPVTQVTGEKALEDMIQNGVKVMTSYNLAEVFSTSGSVKSREGIAFFISILLLLYTLQDVI